MTENGRMMNDQDMDKRRFLMESGTKESLRLG